MKAAVLSLGCPRNTVDSEKYLRLLKKKGFDLVAPEKAEALLINTCGFIEEAKKESIEVIRNALALKKEGAIAKVIVFGCLVKRYPEALRKHLKGVDAYLDVMNIEEPRRAQLEARHRAYLKIAEGCSNRCSYCAIPLIRGPLKSRSPKNILSEVDCLQKEGVKELNLVAQDITSWGADLGSGKDLVWLLKQIVKAAKEIPWIRLLYTHPRFVSQELIELMRKEKKICNYIDMPLQHVSPKILKAMNRKTALSRIETRLKLLKERIPDIAIRTTFLVGFPGETDKDFAALLRFIKKYRFWHVGAFTYSKEENTPAAGLPQVPEKVKKRRLDQLMKTQQAISLERNKSLVGKRFDVIIDEAGKDHSLARAYFQAHEIDSGMIIPEKLQAGSFQRVKVTQAYEYDLVAEVI